jgi:hypothetical protein
VQAKPKPTTMNTKRYEVKLEDGLGNNGAEFDTTDLNAAIKFFIAYPQSKIDDWANEYKGVDSKRPDQRLKLQQFTIDEDGGEEIAEFVISELPEELRQFMGMAADWNLDGSHKTCWVERYPTTRH